MYSHPNHRPDLNQQSASTAAGATGRWDAILAERQTSSYPANNAAHGGNSYQRGGNGFSNNFNNRHNRDHGNGGYAGQQRENHNYGRRDYDSHRPYHSHVGAQSGDATGADWNTPLPANANLER